MIKPFFIVFARDQRNVSVKINELNKIGVPFLIVCGEPLSHPNVIFRAPNGKYDAVNFGLSKLPSGFDVVIFNDVDTHIYNLDIALKQFEEENSALVFAGVNVAEGPQLSFYTLLDFIRRWVPIAASGELMIVRRRLIDKIVPLKPCKAEDSYILFKVLEMGGSVSFCEKCYVVTERTKNSAEEEDYKRRTVCGIYQALAYSKPPLIIRLFYKALPLLSPVLLMFGDRGYYWMNGILLGYKDYLHGDMSGIW